MTTATLTQADLQLRDRAMRQLGWDSQVDSSAIGVSARDGVVSLTGFIESYAGKLAAERAVKRARGVRAVANDLQVTLRLERTDADIAADVVRALDQHATLPPGVQAVVHYGHVTLTGTVHTLFARIVAEKSLRYVKGIKGIVNRIAVVPQPAVDGTQPRIARALHQDADLDARGINVLVSGNSVTLTGTVRSWHERESAERAAMHAPGIIQVDNRLSIVWPDDDGSRAVDDLC
jgi:osmotically-inducible protein OsmY